MKEANLAIKSTIIIILFSFGSKILGFVREMLIASKLGSGAETDVFFISLAIVSLLNSLIVQGLNSTIIPVLSDMDRRENDTQKNIYLSNILNITIVFSLFLIIIGWILVPYIIEIIACGFDKEKIDLSIWMTRVGLFIILFSGIVGVFRSFLQSKALFYDSALADCSFNFSYIIYLIFFVGFFGIKGLMVTSVLAIAIQFVHQIPSLIKEKFKYSLIFDIKEKYFRKILSLLPPIFISVGVLDINLMVDQALASTLKEGSLSALNYSNRIILLIIGVLITAISTVAFPILANNSKSDNKIIFNLILKKYINIITIITVPTMIILIFLSKNIVEIIFERGLFSQNATIMTSNALIFFSFGLIGMSLKLLLDKVYYALMDTRTPMVNGFLAVALNIGLNLIFIKFMDHRGIALATAISANLSTIILLLKLKTSSNFNYYKNISLCFLKSLLASIIMGAFILCLKLYSSLLVFENIFTALFGLFAVLILAISIYTIILKILNVEEIIYILEIVRNKFTKKG